MSNFASDITLNGRLVRDPEMRNNPKSGRNYGLITLVVNKFYPREASNFYTCLFDEAQLERMTKAGVKKGSLIKVIGELTLMTYEKRDSQTKQPTGDHGFDLRVTGYTWDYLPSTAKKTDAAAPASTGAAAPQEAGPATGFDELPVDALGDDDLPF